MAASKPADAKSAQTDGARPADIPAATSIDPSGAPQQVVPDVDMTHPAVDANPRAGTSVDQNRIDFNDPGLDGAKAVADALNAQGVPTKEAGAEDAAKAVKA